jgi:hypothetical protein
MRGQGIEIAEDRNIDMVAENTARELKNVSSRMGPREIGQIQDLISLIGSRVMVKGRPRQISRLVETFLDPQGAIANVDFMIGILTDYPNANITFELHAADGRVINVTRRNMDILSGDLAATLGVGGKR